MPREPRELFIQGIINLQNDMLFIIFLLAILLKVKGRSPALPEAGLAKKRLHTVPLCLVLTTIRKVATYAS